MKRYEEDAMNILYENVDSLKVMEQLPDEEYDLIYLDVPYFMGGRDFSYDNINSRSIRHRLAEVKGVPVSEITMEEVDSEKASLENSVLKQYSSYISMIIENAHRCLKADGTVVFLAPGKEYADINYRLILDQFFSSSMNVTIETRKRPTSEHVNNNNILYFYSKKRENKFPVLKELRPIGEFVDKDERDYYRKMWLYNNISGRGNFEFEWHGITPPKGSGWRYRKEKLDELYEDGRIVFSGDKAFLKCYRGEHPETVSSVWKAEDETKFFSSIDTKSLNRIFTMYPGIENKILCPFDRDGKFSYFADKKGYEWTSVFCRFRNDGRNMLSDIPEGHYKTISSLDDSSERSYTGGIVANVTDITELRNRVKKLSEDVKKIQLSIGIDDNSDTSVEQVIDRIHEQIAEAVSQFSIEGCLPEAEAWLNPYWNKLEPESKHFIPTGLLLYNLYNGASDMDMAPIMIEYCKSLERELFKKMFFGYVQDLISRNVDIQLQFPEAFSRRDTSVFAEFLKKCTTVSRENPQEWKFEIGKMAYVLQSALTRHPRENIIIDFRNYLNRVFDRQFFRERFINQLSVVTRLRNECAHPSVVNNDVVEEGKEIIREKLLLLLQYYME